MTPDFDPYVNEAKWANKAPMCLAFEDRKQFVHNLGVLLSQTREPIVGCSLDNDDQVHVVYAGGHETIVNVRMDSYLAIVSDVARECMRR